MIGAFPLSQSTHWYVAPAAAAVSIPPFTTTFVSTTTACRSVTSTLSQLPTRKVVV